MRWSLVHEWKLTPDKGPGLRGLTATESTSGRQELLGAREDEGVIESFDPERKGVVKLDFDFREFLIKRWGSLAGGASLAAYNEMLPYPDPDTKEKVLLIGLWVNHPDGLGTPLGTSSWYLVRRPGANYELGQVFDDKAPLPASGLRATRTIVVSPFPGDRQEVFYFGGFDAGGAGSKTNTAWIYRAELPAH